jgi:hypothetical protein
VETVAVKFKVPPVVRTVNVRGEGAVPPACEVKFNAVLGTVMLGDRNWLG